MTSHNQRARQLVARGGHICEEGQSGEGFLEKYTFVSMFHHCASASLALLLRSWKRSNNFPNTLNVCHSEYLSFRIAPSYMTSHNQRARQLVARGGHICEDLFKKYTPVVCSTSVQMHLSSSFIEVMEKKQ